MDLIHPEWSAPPGVRALFTTRASGDMASEEARARLRRLLPADPVWLKQVHGATVVKAGAAVRPEADACFTREPGRVCAVMAADCMPVLFADDEASIVAAAHAGWRGLCAGVLERTVEAMAIAPSRLRVWLGPAIGPRAYEVGEDVRGAYLKSDAAAAAAFTATRPGHWLLDLYAVARQRLSAAGVQRIYGGGFCTLTDTAWFFSYRRDGTMQRMAALIWLQSPPP